MIEHNSDLISKEQGKFPLRAVITYSIVGIVLLVIQMSVINLITIGNALPDIILILVIWIGIREGYIMAILYGFALGLLFDIFSYDTVGTNALAKCVAGLLAGFFHKQEEEKQLVSSLRLMPTIFFITLIHNLIYGVFHIQISEWSFVRFFLEYTIASALYTTAFGFFAYGIGSRDKRRPGQG